MVLTDHINFMGANPLRPSMVARASRRCEAMQHTGGTPVPLQRFVDLTDAYDAGLNASFCSGPEQMPLAAAARRLSGRERAELRDAGGNPRVRQTRRGRGGHEHRAGGDGGAAVRIERGGGFLHHQPGGGHWQGKIVARGSFGNSGAREKIRRGAVEIFCGALRKNEPRINTDGHGFLVLPVKHGDAENAEKRKEVDCLRARSLR